LSDRASRKSNSIGHGDAARPRLSSRGMECGQWDRVRIPSDPAHRYNGNRSLALTEDLDAPVVQALEWLRQASVDCSPAYSFAWSAIAFSLHHDETLNRCIVNLHRALSSSDAISDIETLSLAAIAISAAQGNPNPFQVGDLK